jgi:hypothetical protein
MGSSDPFPAGFEIRFGSLNFQATGNDYLMCITNRVELHPWRSTGPGPVFVTPGASPLLLTPQHPHQQMPRALQHLDSDDAPASALAKRGWNDVRLHVSPHNATHPPARQR